MMSDGMGVVVVILLLLNIGLTLWHIWPEPDAVEDIDASNPVGFAAYDPEDHWDDEEPYEVRHRP